jgi:AcrR family transcriptional regulator
MWISKDGDERKQELLEAAFELFYEKGYHKTSINDIISRVGVTKGAFYYYFKSMDDVVESIALSEAERLVEVAQKYSSSNNQSALEKIKGLMTEAITYNKSNAERRIKFIKLMQNEENAKLAQRIHKKVYGVSFPMIKSIIEQGINEGTFKVEASEDAAELYIQLSAIYKNLLIRLLEEKEGGPEVMKIIDRKLAFYRQVLESVLGIEKGYL